MTKIGTRVKLADGSCGSVLSVRIGVASVLLDSGHVVKTSSYTELPPKGQTIRAGILHGLWTHQARVGGPGVQRVKRAQRAQLEAGPTGAAAVAAKALAHHFERLNNLSLEKLHDAVDKKYPDPHTFGVALADRACRPGDDVFDLRHIKVPKFQLSIFNSDRELDVEWSIAAPPRKLNSVKKVSRTLSKRGR